MTTPVQAAIPVAATIVDLLRPWAARVEIAGSIRRLKPQVKDIEVVVMPREIPDGLFFGETRLAVPEVRELAAKWGHVTKTGEKYTQVENVLGSGLTLDLFLVTPPAEWGPIFTIRTGPADFSQMLVTRIKGRLWRCQDGRVTDDRRRHVPCPEEEDFFRAARVEWVPPPERGASARPEISEERQGLSR